MAKSRPGSESGYERAQVAADEANQHSLLNAANGKQEGEQGSDPSKTINAPVHNAGVSSATSGGATPARSGGATKPKRRMSTGLQVMAQIERKLNDLEPKVFNSVLAWLKTLEPRNSDASPPQ